MTFVSFQHAGRSDIGERKRQEDAYGVKVFEHVLAGRGGVRDPSGEEDPGGAGSMELIAVLADGMGGHVGGARASRLTCNSFLSSYPKIEGAKDRRLLLSLDRSNKQIASAIEQDETLQGMGCTLVGVCVDRSGVYWVSVGDSLLYLFHNQKLSRLNEDHSLAPVFDDLVDRGEMSETEARHHPKRNMLRSAITGEEIKLVDLNREAVPLSRGDWLILASDGLASLSNDQISRLVAQNSSGSADQMAQALINGVKRKAIAGQDNITVVVIGFDMIKTGQGRKSGQEAGAGQ